ncbi:MAG: hypothetical protein ACREDL_22210 [Bradyrhizobium sp.]
MAGRPDDLNFEKKTASASESLAHNLAANAANSEKTVHGCTMVQCRQAVKSREKAFFDGEAGPAKNRPRQRSDHSAAPYLSRGNDVTLPKEAAMGGRCCS